MKVTYNWLKDFVDIKVSPEKLSELLTMAGLEVDGIEPAAGEFSGVVVGHVLALSPHPEADRLRVCQVSVGGNTVIMLSHAEEGISPFPIAINIAGRISV